MEQRARETVPGEKGAKVNDTLNFVVPVNPIPWRVPPFSVGRGKNGGVFPRAGKDAELAAYQEAVREAVADHRDCRMLEPPYALEFWFSRRLDRHSAASGRKTQQHIADATNLQKSTEDALQGLVIDNDANVETVVSHIVEQGPDALGFVCIQVWSNFASVTPNWVKTAMAEHRVDAELLTHDTANEWPPRG